MSAINPRQAAMIALIALLAAAVAADQLGLFAGADPARDAERALTPAQRFAVERQAAAQQRQLIDAADDIDQRLRRARGRWNNIEPTLVPAPTRAIAAAEFRDAALAAIAQTGIENATAAPARPTAPTNDDNPRQKLITPVALAVRFETPDTAAAFAAIDRLERMNRPAAAITTLTLNGPGARPSNRVLTVELTLESVAIIEPDPSPARTNQPQPGNRP